MKRAARRIVVSVVVLVLLGGFMLTALQRHVLFPTHLIPPPPADWPRVANVERVDMTIPEGRVEGWFIPGRGVHEKAPGPVVFFGHGNGELIDYAAPGLVPYVELGVSVALLEYRGYGRSAGAPSQDAIAWDMTRFYDAITKRSDVDPKRVVLHGRSLGAGVMCALAQERPPRALVLESAFRSVAVMARKFLVPGFLIRDPFDNEAALKSLELPVLLFHGTRDDIVPYAHGVALAAVAREAKLVSLECGHNDLPPEPNRYWAEIDAYLRARGVLP